MQLNNNRAKFRPQLRESGNTSAALSRFSHSANLCSSLIWRSANRCSTVTRSTTPNRCVGNSVSFRCNGDDWINFAPLCVTRRCPRSPLCVSPIERHRNETIGHRSRSHRSHGSIGHPKSVMKPSVRLTVGYLQKCLREFQRPHLVHVISRSRRNDAIRAPCWATACVRNPRPDLQHTPPSI